MNLIKIKNKLSNLYRKSVIRVFDSTCPLKGELAKSTVIHKKNFFKEHVIRDMEKFSTDELFDFISSIESLTSIFRDYLGFYNIDYVKKWSTAGSNNSSLWHHDSVGHRIKVFIGLSNLVEDTGTCFIPNTHLNKYSDYLETRVKPNCENNQIFINLDRGDLMIFDTNCLHKGVYGQNKRTAFTIEISNPLKAILLPGDIGKRT